MDEQERIKELLSYGILDTPSEEEFDELAEIASAICDTPMSLITFIDEERQWFKSKIGIGSSEIPRAHAFCLYALDEPNDVLVVSDPVHDVRFKDNPYVISEPQIRFYAGAPLKTPNGHVLGSICVLDNKPKEITESQKRALTLLAKKTMDLLNARKLLAEQNRHLRLSEAQLKNLTDQVPGVVYQFQMTPDREMSFSFLSKGITELYPELDPEAVKDNVQLIFNRIYYEDLPDVLNAIRESFTNLTPFNVEFRVHISEQDIRWFISQSIPERLDSGTVIWYGTFQDISNRKEYEQMLEQISFDISHIIRRPISSLLGLIALSEKDNVSDAQLREYNRYIKVVAYELDEFTRKLHDVYYERKVKA